MTELPTTASVPTTATTPGFPPPLPIKMEESNGIAERDLPYRSLEEERPAGSPHEHPDAPHILHRRVTGQELSDPRPDPRASHRIIAPSPNSYTQENTGQRYDRGPLPPMNPPHGHNRFYHYPPTSGPGEVSWHYSQEGGGPPPLATYHHHHAPPTSAHHQQRPSPTTSSPSSYQQQPPPFAYSLSGPHPHAGPPPPPGYGPHEFARYARSATSQKPSDKSGSGRPEGESSVPGAPPASTPPDSPDGADVPDASMPPPRPPPQQSNPSQQRQRTSIACRYCRKRKIRCSGFSEAGKCVNCTRSSQECVFIPVSNSGVPQPAFIPVSALGGRVPAGTQLFGAHGEPIGTSRHGQASSGQPNGDGSRPDPQGPPFGPHGEYARGQYMPPFSGPPPFGMREYPPATGPSIPIAHFAHIPPYGQPLRSPASGRRPVSWIDPMRNRPQMPPSEDGGPQSPYDHETRIPNGAPGPGSRKRKASQEDDDERRSPPAVRVAMLDQAESSSRRPAGGESSDAQGPSPQGEDGRWLVGPLGVSDNWNNTTPADWAARTNQREGGPGQSLRQPGPQLAPTGTGNPPNLTLPALESITPTSQSPTHGWPVRPSIMSVTNLVNTDAMDRDMLGRLNGGRRL